MFSPPLQPNQNECWSVKIQEYELCRDTIKEKKQNQMNNTHIKSTGGFISGEVKMALTLRLMTGSTYINLALLYETGMMYAYKILHDVVCNWINKDKLVKINGEDYLNNCKPMTKVANDFATGSRG